MSQKVVNNTSELANSIKTRRLELGLTIENAASKAGVGTKTWCRYEAGESIRSDKVRGICKTLNWNTLPSMDDDIHSDFDFEEYRKDKAWSDYISKEYGDAAAISFIIGSEILLDDINEDLRRLTSMPKGTHIGQLDFSMLLDSLPEQFVMEYDYDFVYKLKCLVEMLRAYAPNAKEMFAHSVMEELAFYLIIESAEILMDDWEGDMVNCGIDDAVDWREWIYDMFDDCDIVTWLYSGWYLPIDHAYHFAHWDERQFYVEG